MAEVSTRMFLDTSFVLARYGPRDAYHGIAKQLASAITNCHELWTTDAVLFEVGAAFSHPNRRPTAFGLWGQFHNGDPRFRVVEATGPIMREAVAMFGSYDDKEWSLADCLSFVVMRHHNLTDALTADHHFVQAGFRALMLED